MLLYRISKSAYVHDLSGTGGLYAAGRWHRQGTRILYFSEHISLAKLEVLANTIILPKNMSLITIKIDIEPSIQEISADELPIGWEGYPYPEELQRLTDQWIKKSDFLMLKVPSAQAEYEYNYLINPLHELMKYVRTKSIEAIKFDQRLTF